MLLRIKLTILIRFSYFDEKKWFLKPLFHLLQTRRNKNSINYLNLTIELSNCL